MELKCWTCRAIVPIPLTAEAAALAERKALGVTVLHRGQDDHPVETYEARGDEPFSVRDPTLARILGLD